MTQIPPTRMRTLALMITVDEQRVGSVLADLEERGIKTIDYRIVEHVASPKQLVARKATKKLGKLKKAKGKRHKGTMGTLEPEIVLHFKQAGARPVEVRELHKIAKKQGKSVAAVSYVLKSLKAQEAIFQAARGQYQITEGASLWQH